MAAMMALPWGLVEISNTPIIYPIIFFWNLAIMGREPSRLKYFPIVLSFKIYFSGSFYSVKKLNLQNLRRFRDRFGIPISDEQLETVPYYRPEKNSPELSYMRKRRSMLGGNVPSRRSEFGALSVPNL